MRSRFWMQDSWPHQAWAFLLLNNINNNVGCFFFGSCWQEPKTACHVVMASLVAWCVALRIREAHTHRKKHTFARMCIYAPLSLPPFLSLSLSARSLSPPALSNTLFSLASSLAVSLAQPLLTHACTCAEDTRVATTWLGTLLRKAQDLF